MYDLVMTTFTRKKFCQIFNLIQEYDEDLRGRRFYRNETKTNACVWILIVVGSVISLLIILSRIYSFNETWLQSFTFIITYIGAFASVGKFSVTVLAVGFRFQHLNDNDVAQLEMLRGAIDSKARNFQFI